MPQQVRWRKQGIVPYFSGQLSTVQLARGMVYRTLALRLQASIVTSAAGTIGTALTNPGVGAGGIWDVCPTIEIIANGSDSLKRFSGLELRELNKYWYSTPARPDGWLPFPSSGTTIANIDSTLMMPFWMLKAIRPLDTALDSRLLSSLQLNVTWGNVFNVVSSAYVPVAANTAAFAAGSPTMQIYSNESFDPTKTQAFSQFRVFKQIDTADFAGGAVTQVPYQLPVGQMYRAFYIHCQNTPATTGASTGLAVDSPGVTSAVGTEGGPTARGPLSAIRVKSGTTVFADWDANVWQATYGLQDAVLRTEDTAGVQIEQGGLMATGSLYNPDAHYFVDLCTDGFMSEAIDTIGMAEIHLEFDTLAAIPTVNIIPMQIIPIRAAQSAGNQTASGSTNATSTAAQS
jgi:hypothetical protein